MTTGRAGCFPWAAAAVVAAALLAPSPATAWDVTPSQRVAGQPVETNARIEAIVIRCRPDFVIGLLTPAQRVRPGRDDRAQAALFDSVFGKAAAVVDGESFALGAGASGDEPTVYLFPRRRDALLAALHDSGRFAIALDILPRDAKGGEGYETYAWFDGAGLGDALARAGAACARPSGARR